MNKSLLIVWSYFSEAVLATLVLGGLLLLYDSAQISDFLKPVASDIAAYFSSVMFAASVAFLWTFYSKSDTPFSKWLYENNAFTVYLTGYIVAVGIYAALFIVLLVASKSGNEVFLLFTAWLLLVGIINVYTFVRNVVGQLLLNMEFNRRHGK